MFVLEARVLGLSLQRRPRALTAGAITWSEQTTTISSPIVEKLAGGRIIPFLGAGANLCDRGDEAWGRDAVPAERRELAGHLAERGAIPILDDLDLLRVSQYVDAARGEDELYCYLREVFDVGLSRRPRCTSCSRASHGARATPACRSCSR